ncbi:phage protease (plasmid) [Thioclava sp. 'Guangxiensis']|uniref:phage protease n=1 Tax=Thioclava sp. 'Guangxiensis' TaxID=3149044 RepID=UPI0032C3ED0D
MSKLDRHMCALAPLPSEAVDWIELIPVGAFKTADSRDTMTLDDPEGVIARSLAIAPGNVLPIDFDHRSYRAPFDTRAAGWINGLKREGKRVMASVEWTDAGRAALADRSYRFLSPVFKTDRLTRQVTLIEGAGLVNTPALPQLRQLASKENDMDPFEKISGMLGLKADDPDAVEARITALLSGETQLASVIQASGIEGDDSVRQICARLGQASATPDPSQYVPMAMFKDTQRQLASIRTELDGNKVDDAIEVARAAGKITPGMEDWARQLASKDLAAFQSYVESAPVVLSGGRVIEGKPDPKPQALSAEERQICSQMGLSEETFLATRNAERKEN